MDSVFTGQRYRILLGLPHRPAGAKGYPVLWALDGLASFPLMTRPEASGEESPAWRQRVGEDPALLIVAVGYASGEFISVNARALDYTPQVEGAGDAFSPRHGGAADFLAFLTQELRPLLARYFVMDPERHTLFGFSYGALFTLHCLSTAPQHFQRYWAASPSLWFGGHYSLNQLPQRLAALHQQPAVPAKVMITVGAEEQNPAGWVSAAVSQKLTERRMVRNVAQFAALLDQAGLPGWQAQYHCLSAHDHFDMLMHGARRVVAFAAAESRPPTSDFGPLQAGDRGSERWWQEVARQGTPYTEVCGDQARVCFLWRDPAGDETQSDLARVYIDVGSVTDHSLRDPQSLQRIPGSDIWYWALTLPAGWRGSYSFVPVTSGQLLKKEENQRSWWRALYALAQKDPLNRQSPALGTWGGTISALHLPSAPLQSAWQAEAFNPQRLQVLDWHSQALANRRKVWVYQTGSAKDPERPLVILLDGQHWAGRMPVYPALEQATRQGQLPAAVYLLIDVIDSHWRSTELPCNAAFWRAVQNELLPQIQSVAAYSQDPQRTVVAGQSFGGLAAMYAALHWPERFACVLSQSGSFWWPDDSMFQNSDGTAATRQSGRPLCGPLADLPPAALPVRVFQEVGSHEDIMIDVNEAMRDELIRAGHQVNYQVFEGGHDWLCWRGGLLDGLSWLLNSDDKKVIHHE